MPSWALTRSWLPRTVWLTVCTLEFGPMFRQTPYTMVKISVQQKMAETMYQNLGTTPSEMSNDAILMLSLVHDIVTDAVSLAECPDSEFNLESYLKDQKRMRSNTTISGHHEETVFLDAILPVACQACPWTQTTFPHKWQIPKAHQSNENVMCGDYTTEFENDHIFEFANEENEENSKVIDDLPDENYMTIYVKTINGKTISIKSEGKMTAAVISDEVERRSLIPRDMTYLVHKGKVMSEKKTMKEKTLKQKQRLKCL